MRRGLIGSWQRTENIKLAVAELNNTLVRPGEEFSFNKVVGERTVERGYRPAPIFVGEAVVPGGRRRDLSGVEHPVQCGTAVA